MEVNLLVFNSDSIKIIPSLGIRVIAMTKEQYYILALQVYTSVHLVVAFIWETLFLFVNLLFVSFSLSSPSFSLSSPSFCNQLKNALQEVKGTQKGCSIPVQAILILICYQLKL